MSGTTANPYRFGGQVGYRRDSPAQQYVRARHLDTSRGQWISRDLIPLAFTPWVSVSGANSYWYVKNNPATHVDSSGLRPDSDTPIIPCPPQVGQAKDTLCAALRRAGTSGITGSKCCTGPKQAQCLLDWCNNNIGNIYCISDKSKVCRGACAFTSSTDGKQNPDLNSYLCLPAALGPACKGQGAHNCKDIYAATILHERMHACGSQQGGGSPDPDPAENRAQCLCPTLGI